MVTALVSTLAVGCASSNAKNNDETSSKNETTTAVTTEVATEEPTVEQTTEEETTEDYDNYVEISCEPSVSDLNIQYKFNEEFSEDLDGDGTKETIQVKENEDMSYEIVINGEVVRTANYLVKDASMVSVIDLDVTDSYQELCLFTEGMSADFETHIYTYRNGVFDEGLSYGIVKFNGEGKMISYERTDILLGTGYKLGVPYKYVDGNLQSDGHIAEYITETNLYTDVKIYSDDLVEYITDYVSKPSYDKSAIQLLEENLNNSDYIVTTLPKDTKVKVSKVYLTDENHGAGMTENIALYESTSILVYVEAENGQKGWIDTHNIYDYDSLQFIEDICTNGIFYPIMLAD